MFMKSYITDDEFLIKNHNNLINKQIKLQHVKTLLPRSHFKLIRLPKC